MTVLNKGSVFIEYFRLTKPGGSTTIDLVPFVTEFNIYESIFEPFITATAAFDDSLGIPDTDLLSGSIVSIKYKSGIDIEPVIMKFIVDGVNVILPNETGRLQTYSLNLVSEESLRAIAIRVGEIYKDMAPEDMIQHILTSKIKTNKEFYYSKTGSIDSMNCSSLFPFQAIDAIKKRAVSRSYFSSSYMFFENQFGYCFKTLEEILSDAAKDPNIERGDKNFYFDTPEPASIKQTAWRKIEVLQKIKQQSLTEKIMYGGEKSQIFAYNLDTGEHFQFNYNETQDVNKFKAISPKRELYSKVSPDEIYTTGDKLSNLMVAPVKSQKELNRIQKEILSKAYTTKLFSNILRMEISGDSRITVGTAAKLNIPVINSFTGVETNEISTGIYIFARIRHMFRPSEGSTGLGYRQYCEMISTGVS